MTGLPALPEPRTELGAAGLAAIIAEPARAVIATDYDGTLAPIVDRPEEAVAASGAVAALTALALVVGEVAIVTGRPVRDVLRLARLADHPGLRRLVILGQYGVERWDAGRGQVEMPPPLPGVDVVRQGLPELLRGCPDGVLVEDKGHALVIHVRRAADPDAALAALRDPVTRLAAANGLQVAPGRRVLELRPPGYTKETALLGLARERAASAVLFAGDDLGDLPAFEAVDQLRSEGVPGVTVCSDSDEVGELRERADVTVDGPAGVVRFFRSLAMRIGN